MKHKRIQTLALLAGILLLQLSQAFAQTIVDGYVKDSATGNPINYASIFVKGNRGTTTDKNGYYKLAISNQAITSLQVSYVGYVNLTIKITPNQTQTINVALAKSDVAMFNVNVSSKHRIPYRNKNNPAVELIRKVIDHKKQNRFTSHDYLEYEQYEKMQMSLIAGENKLQKMKLMKNYQFLFENRDTTSLEGRSLIPAYIQETSSKKYYRAKPSAEKTVVLGTKQVDFGEGIDNGGIKSLLERLYENVDVYDNNINILTNNFLSPIADLAPTFYMYFIEDTIVVDGQKQVQMRYQARNPEDLLFYGKIYITLDGNYSVAKIDLNVSKKANLNFVRSLKVNQVFERDAENRYHVSLSDLRIDFATTKDKKKGGIFGERLVAYKDFTINKPEPDSLYKQKELETAEVVADRPDSFWNTHRSPPLTESELKTYQNIDSLHNMRSYKRLIDIATLLLAGYHSFGAYEVGPVNAFYSFNPVEGFKLRLGGRTTTKLSKNIYFENYLAYGFKDERLKYFLSGTYSLNHKSIYSFPLNFIKVSYQYDTQIPGQDLQFVNEDNFLLSFKRGDNNKWLYNRTFTMQYVREFGKNFSYTFQMKNLEQKPAGSIIYDKIVNGTDVNVTKITNTELSAQLRWAPNEKFYQGKVYRIPIPNKYPIFKLRFAAGVKGPISGDYNYQSIDFEMAKQNYFTQLGYGNLVVQGGVIFGQVPFPLLDIHHANQSYAYQLNSYNLMNFMEFVSDHYAAISYDHNFQGFFLNKIPLLKKLKLREAFSIKSLWGGVRNENNPAYNINQFLFPKNTVGEPTTYSLSAKPYVEGSVGLGNIFKLLRVDYVRRFTYLDHPNVSKAGIRARFSLEF